MESEPKQLKEDIETWYLRQDPWEYENNPEDIRRKHLILSALNKRMFKRALDIGCGEGWITKDLPAGEIHGIEISDNASLRFPPNVKRVTEPEGMYDLVIATGVMYEHYDYKKFLKWIREHASGIVVLCNIKEWEVPIDLSGDPDIRVFPYRNFTQRLRVYDLTS